MRAPALVAGMLVILGTAEVVSRLGSMPAGSVLLQGSEGDDAGTLIREMKLEQKMAQGLARGSTSKDKGATASLARQRQHALDEAANEDREENSRLSKAVDVNDVLGAINSLPAPGAGAKRGRSPAKAAAAAKTSAKRMLPAVAASASARISRKQAVSPKKQHARSQSAAHVKGVRTSVDPTAAAKTGGARFEGKKASLFDLLEDLDYDDCLAKAQAIAGVKGKRPSGKMQAFVFIKPHAVTDATEKLATQKFQAAGITVYKEGSLTGSVIEKDKLIDNHYYAIANKASLSKPAELNPPAAKQKEFAEKFGITWKQALADGIVYNAVDACGRLGIDGEKMNEVWSGAKKAGNLVKFGGGFYAGKIPAPQKKSKLVSRRTSGDMSVFTSGESAIDAVLSAEGGKML